MIAKHPPGRSHDSTAATPPITPHHGTTSVACQMHEHHVVTKLASLSSRAAQAFFWRLPYRLRQRVFRRLRPELAGYYKRLLNGQDGGYSIQPMLERGCLFIHIPKCAGLAVSHALFGGLGGGHLPVAHYQLMLDASQYMRLFKFAVVRNPFDRLLSAYRFLASGGLNARDAAWAAHTLPAYDGFSDFVERWLTPQRAAQALHFRPQVSFLRIPGRRRIEVDFIARQEHLAEDFVRLCSHLGVGHLPLERRNLSAPPDTDYRHAYSDRAREIATAVYRDDLTLIGCTF